MFELKLKSIEYIHDLGDNTAYMHNKLSMNAVVKNT